MERVQYNTGLLKQQYNKRPTFGVHLKRFGLTKNFFESVSWIKPQRLDL